VKDRSNSQGMGPDQRWWDVLISGRELGKYACPARVGDRVVASNPCLVLAIMFFVYPSCSFCCSRSHAGESMVTKDVVAVFTHVCQGLL